MRLWILAALPSLLATGTGVGQHYGISTPVTLKTYLKTSNSTYYLQDTATSSAERRICTTNSNGSQNPSLTTNFSDADNVWDSTDLSNQASVDVHYAAQFAFDYFKTVHGLANMDPVHGGPYSYEASADGIDCLWLGVNRQVSTNAIWNPELLRLVFGNGDGDDSYFSDLNNPWSVAVDSDGNLFIADTYNHRVRKVSIFGIITTVAGDGTGGDDGDNGPATDAQLNYPMGVAISRDGNLFIADTSNHRIRKVDPDGDISTFAGTGTAGFSTGNGSAPQAQINSPRQLFMYDEPGVDPFLYFADSGNHRIRKISEDNQIISTVAGNGQEGFSGDTGQATSAKLNDPVGVVVDNEGGNAIVYIGDTGNARIRKVASDGVITTIAGTSIPGFTGDGGQAASARLNTPFELGLFDVEYEPEGRDHLLYFADYTNSRVRRIDLESGIIETFAGTGALGYDGDHGDADQADLHYPCGIAVDEDGHVVIADNQNHAIRKVWFTEIPD